MTITTRGPVISFGEALIDLIADPGHDLGTATSLAIREGGAPMNFAVALARLGVPSALATVVGDDPFGRRLVALLDAEGVETSGVRITSEADTTIAYAWRNARGDGSFRLVRMADRLLSVADVERASIGAATAILAGSVALAAQPSRAAVERAVDIAVQEGVPVIFDVNVRPTLWPDVDSLRAASEPILAAAHVIKLSLDDAAVLWGSSAIVDVQQALAAFAAPYVVVTDGGRAAWSRIAGTWAEYAVFAVDAVEPTGAGDAFNAAFVSRLIANDWARASAADVRFAMAAGAIATTKPGAIAALPTVAEVEAFLAARTA